MVLKDMQKNFLELECRMHLLVDMRALGKRRGRASPVAHAFDEGPWDRIMST